MYPKPFEYHRAGSLAEAARLLVDLGEEATLLAGGQSLIPLMKLRFASPRHLIDLNFVPEAAYLRETPEEVAFGPLLRHAQAGKALTSPELAILRDCALGIADVQVRNRGTIAGSVAEADPSGDWIPVLLTFETVLSLVGTDGEREVPLREAITGAFTTTLERQEVIREIRLSKPAAGSGGAYLAFKRSAQVYASASAAVRLDVEEGVCTRAHICLGSVGLTAIRAREAEKQIEGRELTEEALDRAAEAAREAADPQSDMRGSAEYKKNLVQALVKRAARRAMRRVQGEVVEGGHLYG